MIGVTRIRLIGSYFNVGINDYLEVSENVVVPLNFGISDVRDFTSKTGSFSKSIKIIGTKHNNLVFDNIFDVNNVTLDFNINKKQQCLIEQDGEVVLDNAIMQLIDVEKVSTGIGYDEQIIYTITVKDTVSELFTDIGNKLLTDLDFSDFNHVYTSTDVVESFDNVKEDGYKYILPITDNSQYSLTEMKPAIYVWQYLNRIFSSVGYSYQFDELESIGVDKMLIPYNGGKSRISEDVQAIIEVIADESSEQIFSFSSFPFWQKIDVTNELKDDNSYYNPTLSEYNNSFELSSPNELSYEIEINHSLFVDCANPVRIDTFNNELKVLPRLEVRNQSNITKGVQNGYYDNVSSGFTVNANGQVVIDDTYIFPTGETLIASGTSFITLSCTDITITDILTLGGFPKTDLVPVWVEPGVGTSTADIVMIINYIKIRVVPSAESLGYNFPVVINDFVPANIKQSDFLKSIFTLFNLFVIPDIDNPRNIILMTRDKYYDSGITKDFTTKLFKELPQTLTFLPELTAKKITFSYADDSDQFNTIYKKNVNETYGQIEYTFDNEYIKNEVRKDVIFGASPFVTTPFGATVMAINGSEPKTLPRIVFDGGLYPCGIFQINDTTTLFTSVNQYPFVGHFNAPKDASKDLNFGTCDYYFDNNYGVIPYNNLGNTYWRRTVSQINSGTLYTVYLNVNSFDVSNLRLNDKIYLDRSYWLINKVIDYDANSNAPTKFELLSVDQEISLPRFKTRKPTKPSKSDVGIVKPIKNTLIDIYSSLTSDSSSGGVTVIGKGNQIFGGVKNALIVGDNQSVVTDGIYTPTLFIDGKQSEIPKFTFKALITQIGTSDPTLNVAVDQFGITAVRISTGIYQLISDYLFTGQVICQAVFGKQTLGLISIGRISNDIVEIRTINGTGTLTDALLDNTTIIIESWQTK